MFLKILIIFTLICSGEFMYIVKIKMPFQWESSSHEWQTLEFGDTYTKFSTKEILTMVLDLLDGQEVEEIKIERK